MTQPNPPPKEHVLLSGVTGSLAAFQRPTFTQTFGARSLYILLGVICVLVVAFFGAWLATRPTLAQVREALGVSAEPKMVLETLRELQRDHVDYVRSLFQLLVVSGLIPLVTLLGSRHQGKAKARRPSPPPAWHGIGSFWIARY